MKKFFVTLVTSICFALTFTGCGNSETAEPIDQVITETEEIEEVTEEVTKEAEEVEVTEVTEEAVEVVEEEPVVETTPSYIEEQGAKVTEIDLDETYSNAFTFVGYNEDQDNNPIMDTIGNFNCPVEVTKEEVYLDDGTKIVTYKSVYDIRDWSLEYYYYSSVTYLIDQETGTIYKSTDTFSPEVNGETTSVKYEFVEDYDENYTTHTKYFSITCPQDYDDYAFIVAETLVPVDTSNLVIITDTGVDFSNNNYVVLH
ncbi:MAG: hypothetical protein MJ245_07700 [Clostridia bacterium]|nr:hypothetical protein [Clostridia bacterium]